MNGEQCGVGSPELRTGRCGWQQIMSAYGTATASYPAGRAASRLGVKVGLLVHEGRLPLVRQRTLTTERIGASRGSVIAGITKIGLF